MSGPNWAALAIPVFLAFTALEAWVARRRRLSRDGESPIVFGTAIADLSCGSVFAAGEILFKLLTFTAYVWLFEHRVIDWPEGSALPWLLGIVGVDVLFYWWHRASHVVNVLWAVHGVHHQSEDYNLAVALRQPLLEPLTWFLFYAPLALLGVSPVIYLAAYAINRVYQFFIHTELVRKLGPLEWVLNTPSHHRVHHGVQPQYLDKNYGAVLIVWDVLFGTFEPEREAPRYGTTIPLRSYNPLWANVEHFVRIGALARRASRMRDKLWAPLAHPAWRPRGVPEFTPKRSGGAKYRPHVPPSRAAYVLLHFGLAGGVLGLVSFFEHDLPLAPLAAIVGVLIASFVSLSALLEQQPWALRVEGLRLCGLASVGGWLLHRVVGLSAGSLALALVAAVTTLLAPLALLLWVETRPSRSAPH